MEYIPKNLKIEFDLSYDIFLISSTIKQITTDEEKGSVDFERLCYAISQGDVQRELSDVKINVQFAADVYGVYMDLRDRLSGETTVMQMALNYARKKAYDFKSRYPFI
jgi:hypothetical protein